MKKLIGLILLGCFFISGCGGGKPSDKKGGSEARPKEITMWLIGSEAQALTIKELAKEFTKESGVRVECDAISWGDAHSKYLTSIAGGVAPDIGTMGLTWGTEFGNLGSMIDLKSAYPNEVEEIRSSVFNGLWDSVEHKNRVFGIPFDMTEYVMYYRTDIIPEPPKTWDELAALLLELNKKGKGMIFDWGSLSWIGYSPFLWQTGGDYYSEDYSSVIIDSPEAVEAMNFFAGLYTKYGVPKTKIPVEQGMRTGDFPLAISGNWKIDDIRLYAPEIAGKWSIAAIPKGPTGKRTGFIGGRIMGIFKQSKNAETAWKFINFLFRPETQKKLYEAALIKQDTYLPPSKRTWDILVMEPVFKDVLITQADDAKGPPAIANWDSCAKYVDEAIQKVVLQNADPQKELAYVKDQLIRLQKK